MPVTIDGTNGITTPTYNGADTSEYLVPVTAFKNRLINGAMMIDQRNAGASVTPSNNFTIDRWAGLNTQASKFTVQRSSTAPSGFVNSLLATSSSAYSVLTGDTFGFRQPIEGFNVADLGWGAAGAATVTLSFWVRSSLTGTFGGALCNGAANRSYPFSYTISAANTWEQKSVTIAGDTSGTWATDNTMGIDVRFGLGSGSTFSGTSGAWAAGNLVQPTGTVSVIGTSGATFYITGVQLEKGSTATSFDYRPYGTELSLCQRYFIKYGTYASLGAVATYGAATSTTTGNAHAPFPVEMRSTPTFGYANLRFGDGSNSQLTVTSATIDGMTNTKIGFFEVNVSGATQFRPYSVRALANTGYIQWSAEL